MKQSDTNAGLAALSILGGMFSLGLTDNFVPLLSAEGSLWQFHFIRSGMGLTLLGIVAAMGFGILRPLRPAAVLGRSFFTATAMLIYFGCLSILPIGVVVAGLFTAPLFVLLITVLFQRKRVGPIRWLAVCLGFVGALMVIRPDPANLDMVAFLPIAAAGFYAVGAVATRAWCNDEGTLALTAGFFIMLMIFGGIGLLVLDPGGPPGDVGFSQRGWVPLTANLLFWTFMQAVGSIIGIGLIFRGYLLGDATEVAVFEYSLLVFASFWAWVLWGQTVPLLAVVGMVLIAGAGIIIAKRENLRAGMEN